MRIIEVKLHNVRLPIVRPFTTSFGTQTVRSAIIVEVRAEAANSTGSPTEVIGWGECVALADPLYSPEYTEGARQMMIRYLLPALFNYQARHGVVTAETVGHSLRAIVGHQMAKSALEMAVLDAQLRARGESFGQYLGATVDRVPSGVSVGIQNSIPELLDTVAEYVEDGYQRIKLKIQPGWDIEPVAAVREHFGPNLLLQVDANAAFTLADAVLLRKLDAFDLLLIEQPLGEADLRQHAELAALMSTPMCLDESISSAETAMDAIAIKSAAVINIKPGRVGGYLEARRIHDIARASGVAVWCGGMLETGLGRAANAALSALPGFTLPGDISASSRYYETDLTEPFVLDNGYINVPTGPGLGVEPIPEILRQLTTDLYTLAAA
ncbi:o-succinylbenzoate synthase [Arthrobacter sp. FW306-05-C]|uniref:o-succinylbenzoate synthase n=1 Tax=Arthrobacter sp. FW306-05-C TaxID=2879620 RepID=UPI001F02E93B|nr:o-succinylbenzoate synthase [Arthrobacter sp. FW306-05-C]UKA66582.1 o-succinylbenzoate synthase [Arthrobacter sp. FW306-05-C]